MAARPASLMGRRHHADPRVLASCLAVAAILGAVLAPAVAARDNSWTLSRTPPSVHVDQATTITFLATNTSEGGGGGEIGCIEIVIPSVFSVGAVSVTSEPSGANWTDSKAGGPGGSTIVRLRAANDGSVLEGDPQDDELGFTIRVTGSTQGATTWTADVFNKIDCDNDMGLTKNVIVTISASGQATPTPAPTPALTPPPTPVPTPTPTPKPTAAPTPTPTATPTPRPTPTPTPVPGVTATPTARPTATPVGGPTASPTPAPTGAPGATPTPAATGAPGASSAVLTPGPSSSAPPGASASPTTVEPTPAPSSEPGERPVAGVGGGDPPPGAAFTFEGGSGAGATDAGIFSDSFAQFTAMFGRAFDWAVPGLVLSIPGMLLVLAIAAQAAGALAWLPLVRRRIGGFGLGGTPAASRH